MPALISVLYNKEKIGFSGENYLNGIINNIGEVLEDDYKKALYIAVKTGSNPTIPVRFPLITPGCHNYNKSKIDKQLFLEEGIFLPAISLKEVEDTPISLYQREPLLKEDYSQTNLNLFKTLLKENKYLYTKNITIFKKMFHFIMDACPHWWKVKTDFISLTKAPTYFLEARFYGGNTVVPIYAPNNFKSIVMEVIIKQKYINPEGAIKSNVYIASIDKEYIEILDGITESCFVKARRSAINTQIKCSMQQYKARRTNI